MRIFCFTLFVFLAFCLGGWGAESATIALVGDSTVESYQPDKTILRGWGQLLPEFLAPGTKVLNVAQSGRSTSTFPKENWQKVLDAHPLCVLIQFGHNDSHPKERPEATDAATDYRDNLRRYIREAREANIQPILVTPVCRRTFREDGTLKDNLAPYAESMKIVAEEMKVPVVDLHALSRTLLEKLGETGSESFTANRNLPKYQTDPTAKDGESKGGKSGDRTHFTETGAREMARLVAEALPIVEPSLAGILRQP